MSNARAVMDAAISEADFQRQVIALAETCGWAVYHNPDSRRSTAGHPDLVMVHSSGVRPIVYLELKTEKGRLKPEQRWWLERLDMGPAMYDYVVARMVRPSHWPWIESLLTGGDDWKEEPTT